MDGIAWRSVSASGAIIKLARVISDNGAGFVAAAAAFDCRHEYLCTKSIWPGLRLV